MHIDTKLNRLLAKYESQLGARKKPIDRQTPRQTDRHQDTKTDRHRNQQSRKSTHHLEGLYTTHVKHVSAHFIVCYIKIPLGPLGPGGPKN